eukprot:6470431-Amphidinium_carterae.1
MPQNEPITSGVYRADNSCCEIIVFTSIKLYGPKSEGDKAICRNVREWSVIIPFLSCLAQALQEWASCILLVCAEAHQSVNIAPPNAQHLP